MLSSTETLPCDPSRDGLRDLLLPRIGGGRGALGFRERSGGGERMAAERDGGGARRVQALPPHRIIELGFWGGGGGFLVASRIRGSGGAGRTGGGVVRW
jgi:hypothetical protein